MRSNEKKGRDLQTCDRNANKEEEAALLELGMRDEPMNTAFLRVRRLGLHSKATTPNCSFGGTPEQLSSRSGCRSLKVVGRKGFSAS